MKHLRSPLGKPCANDALEEMQGCTTLFPRREWGETYCTSFLTDLQDGIEMLLSLIMCAATGFASKSYMPLHFVGGIGVEKLVSGTHGLTGVRLQVSQVGRLTMQANRLISRWKPKHLLLPLSQISSELDKLVRISALFPFGQILDQKENLLILITTR